MILYRFRKHLLDALYIPKVLLALVQLPCYIPFHGTSSVPTAHVLAVVLTLAIAFSDFVLIHSRPFPILRRHNPILYAPRPNKAYEAPQHSQARSNFGDADRLTKILNLAANYQDNLSRIDMCYARDHVRLVNDPCPS